MKIQTQTLVKNEILVVTSFPPRECGIATYSLDLINAMKNNLSGSYTMRVCALENSNCNTFYPEIVKYTLNTSVQREYYDLARAINEDPSIMSVLIQHEFGLFGGEYGDMLLDLISEIEKPVDVTFHTVLPTPDRKRQSVVQKIATRSRHIVVMTNDSKKLLENDYYIPKDKIAVIPHGTHPIEIKDKDFLKAKYGYENRLIASTFGLLSSNKNIECALDVMPLLAKKYPDILYLIIGKTHPEVYKNEGEEYRQSLEQKVLDLGLTENVRFINEFKELDELLELLQMSDIYLFTSKDRNQAVSGTFAYALASGCPIIAKGIPHAKELLCPNTGIMVDFDDPEGLQSAWLCLIENKAMRIHMSKNAIQKSKETEWNNVALLFGQLFKEYLGTKKLSYDLPKITFKHLLNMTADYGVIQFSKLNIPDPTSGYTLDDNARALIVSCMDFEIKRNLYSLPLIDTYLNFIELCQKQNGIFINYVDENGHYDPKNIHEDENLEDSNGRAIWALGTIVQHRDILPQDFVIRAEVCLNDVLPWIKELRSPRAIAFAIKGLYAYNLSRQSGCIRFLIHVLATKLELLYCEVSSDKWDWFEDKITYANSIMPEAMLLAHLSTKNLHFKNIARTSLDFLLSKIIQNGEVRIISNQGWINKYENKAWEGGEQPIDVAYTVNTLALFLEVYPNSDYKEKMNLLFSWFLGNNALNQKIYNSKTGGCHDGLEKTNVNLNQGAESTICYLMARISIEKVKLGLHLLPEENHQHLEFNSVPLGFTNLRETHGSIYSH